MIESEEKDFVEPIFVETFDDSETDNEKEEDINQIESLDLKNMAITGTDWTAETIVNQIRKGNIILSPAFQRRDAWTKKTKSRFIESLILGLPIPQIILAEKKEKKGTYIVIDGKQRLLSLQQFVDGYEDGSKLRLSGLEIKSQFNRKTYEEIEASEYCDDIEVFSNQPIRTIVIKNWPSVEVLYLIFLRLNTGSVKLSPQELRQALYPGKFTEYVTQKSGTSEPLQKMLNLKKADFRMRDVEILIRYFAFAYRINEYSGSMQLFLDKTCELLNQQWDQFEGDIHRKFDNMEAAIQVVQDVFKTKAFKKYKNGKYEDKYNRAVIDIMLYYFSNPQVRANVSGKEDKLCEDFQELCSTDTTFLESIETTTKSTQAVRKRFTAWGEILERELSIPNLIPECYK